MVRNIRFVNHNLAEMRLSRLPILPKVNICRAHSIIVRPYIPVGDTALFIEGKDKSCEIYPRPYTDEDAERDQAEVCFSIRLID